MRENAGGEYRNSIFAEQAKGIDIEYREDGGGSSVGQCSYSQWDDEGILKWENNIFQNVSDGTGAGIFKVASPVDDDDLPLFTVPDAAGTAFADDFATAGNKVMDAGVDAANPTASGDVYGADFTGMDAWFTIVDYIGAFKPNENWAQGWSLSLGDVDARENMNTGIDRERKFLPQVTVFPNPAVDLISVVFGNPDGVAHSFTMYDMAGRSVRMFSNIYGSSFQMERGNLKEGLYLYKLSNEEGVVAKGKLILK